MSLVPRRNGSPANRKNKTGLAKLPTDIVVACRQARLSCEFINSKRAKLLCWPFSKLKQDEVAGRINNIAAAGDAIEGYILYRMNVSESMASTLETMMAIRSEHHGRYVEYMQNLPDNASMGATRNPRSDISIGFPSDDPLIEFVKESGFRIQGLDARALGLVYTFNDQIRRLRTCISQHRLAIPQDMPLPDEIHLLS